jgi:hemerythrin
MKEFRWLEALSVGVPGLDDNHKAFFAHLAQIIAALDRQAFDEAERSCRALIALGTQHAADEAEFLRRNRYPHPDAVIAVQQAMGRQCQNLLALIVARSADARAVASETSKDLVEYLLRGDINFKSYVQEMRDLGRLK